jgi:preprotein translocase subunit SecB
MAENTNNGQGSTPEIPTPQGSVTLAINAQYIKDLSFENPRAPQSLIQQTQQPQVQLDVNVQARNLAPDLFEVILTMSAKATAQEEPVFVVELTYGAVVTAKSDDQNLMPLLVLVEAPRMMFPFARNIIANATRDGGFPPLLVNPIDFAELLRRQQQEGGGAVPTATA